MEQELGNGWTDGVHPDDLERCVSVYESSLMCGALSDWSTASAITMANTAGCSTRDPDHGSHG
jgi:hypothetical protein